MTETVAVKKTVNIYTDGACSGNPGPGGFGVVLEFQGQRRELSGGYRDTTNNRMEIMAAIVGLETLKEPCRVHLYSDSRYLVDAMTKGWVQRWRAKGWTRDGKQPAMNPDLWVRLLKQTERHEVAFHWVRGHAGHPENERCDQLATAAIRGGNLAVDERGLVR
ncbi:ribonuclease HI [Heliophilum fasciatum]|uniref:Ribonuclease H n=1 Tax=Heliophilum fasciatum TaxID=35700 RepID=A0A4R2RY88_9FIRM|nr:ribonuclease HI [Heliophilum fasciatum]MCW2276990.1 ribonuclease HI [Heliophilum fasciatum]TCP68484.1 RNase HI [Heliophilum fasciatum]